MSALEEAAWRVILAWDSGASEDEEAHEKWLEIADWAHGRDGWARNLAEALQDMTDALVEQQRATATVVESCLSCGAPALIPHVDTDTGDTLCNECYDASLAARHHDKPEGD